jgi:hypothetical protein
MDKSVIERRTLLRGAGVAGAAVVGVAAVPAVASAQQNDHGSRLLGAWMITHTDNPQSQNTPVVAIVTFAAGGVVTNLDINPPSPPGLGAWESSGDRFKVTFWQGDAGNGGSAPPIVVRVQVRGRLHGDHISGTYRVTVFSASDNSVLARGSGVFTGNRLQA